METKMPDQPIADMTSVNLIDPSEDSFSRNNLTYNLNATISE